MRGAMSDWNTVGVGTRPDHEFFSEDTSSVAVSGRECTRDGINTVAFSNALMCQGLGDALGVASQWAVGGKIVEADILFAENAIWDLYEGELLFLHNGRLAKWNELPPGPVTPVEDFYRVAAHEFGHVVGLDHPNDVGQRVRAVMNQAFSSSIEEVFLFESDRIAPDDIAGAHAVPYTPPLPKTLSVAVSGGGIVTPSDPPGIRCRNGGPQCVAEFPHRAAVELTVSLDAGWALDRWNGCNSTTLVCRVTLERNRNVSVELRSLSPTPSTPSTSPPPSTVPPTAQATVQRDLWIELHKSKHVVKPNGDQVSVKMTINDVFNASHPDQRFVVALVRSQDDVYDPATDPIFAITDPPIFQAPQTIKLKVGGQPSLIGQWIFAVVDPFDQIPETDENRCVVCRASASPKDRLGL